MNNKLNKNISIVEIKNDEIRLKNTNRNKTKIYDKPELIVTISSLYFLNDYKIQTGFFFVILSILLFIYKLNVLSSIRNMIKSGNFVINMNTSKIILTNCEFDTKNYLNSIPYKSLNTFKGKFRDRDAAICRYENVLVLENNSNYKCSTNFYKELNILNSISIHSNIVKLLGYEMFDKYSYIATELCTSDLYQFFKINQYNNKIDSKLKISLTKLLLRGLRHLHNSNITHGNLSCQNILINITNNFKYNEQGINIVLSDFKHSKMFKSIPNIGENYQSSVRIAKKDYFNVTKKKLNDFEKAKTEDIFQYGIMAFYIMSNGNGQNDNCYWDYDTCKNKIWSLCAENFVNKSYQWELVDLLSQCLHHDQKYRASAESLSKHPLFWDNTKKTLFITDVSNKLEGLPQRNDLILSLERSAPRTIRGNWMNVISKELIDDFVSYRSYSGSSCRDLLRVIRNKKNHFAASSPQVLQLFQTPDELTKYFVTQFPLLIITVFNIGKKSFLADDPAFTQFFGKYQIKEELQFYSVAFDKAISTINTVNFNNSSCTLDY